MSGNPFKKFFRLAGFNENDFVLPAGDDVRLDTNRIEQLGFEPMRGGGLTVYRKSNDLGGFDYLPFVDRWYPGTLPEADPDKDRWLEGYDRGFVLFIMGEAQNRQYVQHSADGSEVTKYPPPV